MLLKYYDSINTDLFNSFKFFDDLYGTTWNLKTKLQSSTYRVNTTDEGLELSLDLPGVKSKDLSVNVTGRIVNVGGKLRGEDFKHSYSLSKDYDVNSIDATLEDGVLVLKFDRLKEESKSINVKVK